MLSPAKRIRLILPVVLLLEPGTRGGAAPVNSLGLNFAWQC